MQSSAAVIMSRNMHWIIHKDYYIFPSEKRECEKFSTKTKLYVRGECKGFNLLSHYENTSLLSLLWRSPLGNRQIPGVNSWKETM